MLKMGGQNAEEEKKSFVVSYLLLTQIMKKKKTKISLIDLHPFFRRLSSRLRKNSKKNMKN